MERMKILPIVLALAATAFVCATVAAQTERVVPETELKSKPVRNRAQRPTPFPAGVVLKLEAAKLSSQPMKHIS